MLEPRQLKMSTNYDHREVDVGNYETNKQVYICFLYIFLESLAENFSYCFFLSFLAEIIQFFGFWEFCIDF